MSHTPAERMAARLEILATVLRHPSGQTNEYFRQTFEEFNALRKAYPELLTNDELGQAMKEAHESMQDMREHPYRGNCGDADHLGDIIERLEAEHQKRFA